jgi:hypothetical protein
VIKCQNGKAKISRGEIKNGFKRMKGFVTLKIKRNKKVKKIWTLSTYKETHYISPATGAGAVNKWAIKKKYDSNGYYCHLDGSGVKDEKTAIYMSTNSNVVKNADAKNKKIKDKWINIKVTTKYICQYHIKNGVKVGKARYLDSESNIIKDKWITIEKRKECVYQFHIINGIKVGTQYYSKAKKATKKPQC